MIGAIIGDIIGSRFEFNNTDNFNFKLFAKSCAYTDDTICTIAIADAVMMREPYGKALHRWCREYPNPMGSYGCSFAGWIASNNPRPYNSFGNGSAIRVSAIGWLFDTLEQVEEEAMLSAMPTHNHPEGIKGAVATASAIFLAHTQGKEAMLEAMKSYYPQWKEPCLGENRFDETCQGTMPVVFGIIQKANSFEEAIRYAIAVGGDSDTIGAIVGGIAEAIWGMPEYIRIQTMSYLPNKWYKSLNNLTKIYPLTEIDNSHQYLCSMKTTKNNTIMGHNTIDKHLGNFNIAGFTFWDGCEAFGDLKVGTSLHMVREADNKFDPYAVAIYYKDTKLGFIPRGENQLVAQFMDLGYNMIFDLRVQRICPDAHPEKQVGVILRLKEANKVFNK